MSAKVQFIFSFTQFLRNVCIRPVITVAVRVLNTIPAPSASITLTPRWQTLPCPPPCYRSKCLLCRGPPCSFSPTGLISAYSIKCSTVWTFSPNKNINATSKGVSYLPDVIVFQTPRTVLDTHQCLINIYGMNELG